MSRRVEHERSSFATRARRHTQPGSRVPVLLSSPTSGLGNYRARFLVGLASQHGIALGGRQYIKAGQRLAKPCGPFVTSGENALEFSRRRAVQDAQPFAKLTPLSSGRLLLAVDKMRPPRKVGNWLTYANSGHRIGPAHAKLTIVEYGDFQCPACGAFFRGVEGLRTKHPDQVAIVFHHFPLSYHKYAYVAARAAECAGDQGRFVEMYEALYRNQESLGVTPFEIFAKRAGVPDSARFERCVTDPGTQPVIEGDIAAGRALKIHGTPGVLVNGYLYNATPRPERLEAMLRQSTTTQ